jgi:hypothetical protein
LFCIDRGEEFHDPGEHPGPTRLVAGTDAPAGVAMEITSAAIMCAQWPLRMERGCFRRGWMP